MLLKLNANNFTTLNETPWAGTHLSQQIKKSFLSPQTPVGESWEVSTDPKHPSIVSHTGKNLSDTVAFSGREFLGATSHCGIEILFKFISTCRPLSVQVHPADGDIGLTANECGKPECWYVLDCEPGAGVYIGFRENISKEKLRNAILVGADLSDYLNFIPVDKGDYFEILPNVVHAIGKGLLLAEPQRILSGKSGKTFRLWDWNRLYDSKGNISPTGKKRELHIDQGLQIVEPSLQTGTLFFEKVKLSPKVQTLGSQAQCKFFPKNAYFQFMTLIAAEDLNLKMTQSCYSTFVVGSGKVDVHSKSTGSMSLSTGESAVIGAMSFPVELSILKGTELFIVNPSDHNLILSGY